MPPLDPFAPGANAPAMSRSGWCGRAHAPRPTCQSPAEAAATDLPKEAPMPAEPLLTAQDLRVTFSLPDARRHAMGRAPAVAGRGRRRFHP